MSSLPRGVAYATEHRDVTGIGRGPMNAVCTNIKPIVVVGLPLVRDLTPLSNPKIKFAHPYNASYSSRLCKKQVLKALGMTADLHGFVRPSWRSLIAQDCINQAKEAY